MGVYMLYTECTLKPYNIFKVKYRPKFIQCAQNKFSCLAHKVVTIVNYSPFQDPSHLTLCCLHVTPHILPANLAKSNILASSPLIFFSIH
jgi:hypothetical protein